MTRDGVRGEGIRGGYGAVYAELRALETLGVCRRGYFVEGLGGAQFALPGAVERLRELRSAGRRDDEPEALVLAAADPAQPYGAALPWPRRSGARAARVAGAWVVLLDGEAALFVERGGRSLVPLREPDPEWLRPALAALVAHVRAGGAKRLAVERFDGVPVVETETMALLVEAGFLAGPRRAVLASITQERRCGPRTRRRGRARAPSLSAPPRIRARLLRRARSRARGGSGAAVRLRGARRAAGPVAVRAPPARARVHRGARGRPARARGRAARRRGARTRARGGDLRARTRRPSRRARTKRSSARCSSGCSISTAEACGGFDWDDEAFERAYAELEQSLFGERRRYVAVAPLIGISLAKPAELAPGPRRAPVRRRRALDALARVARAAPARLRARAGSPGRRRAPRASSTPARRRPTRRPRSRTR